MGQKVHPIGFRLGLNKPWLSHWYADANSQFVEHLQQDWAIRQYIYSRHDCSNRSKIEIERSTKSATVKLHSSKVGAWIGEKGETVKELNTAMKKKLHQNISLDVVKIDKPSIDAHIIANNLAKSIRERVAIERHLRLLVRGISKCTVEVVGIKILISGRISGAEIASAECIKHGVVSNHTIRSKVGYGTATSDTKYAAMGVKVWMFYSDMYQEHTSGSRSVKESRSGSTDTSPSSPRSFT